MAIPIDPGETKDGPATPDPSAGDASAWRLFLVWLRLGVQSFGGGVATLTLIRREAVERERWISAEDFARIWGLVQLAPGINLLALTILLGKRAGGVRGIVAALAGLLLPSAGITVLLTALYARVEQARWVQLALRGVIPATVGLGVLTGLQIVLPILAQSRREGAPNMAAAIFVLAASTIAAVYFHGPVVWVLVVGGSAGAVAGAVLAGRENKAEELGT